MILRGRVAPPRGVRCKLCRIDMWTEFVYVFYHLQFRDGHYNTIKFHQVGRYASLPLNRYGATCNILLRYMPDKNNQNAWSVWNIDTSIDIHIYMARRIIDATLV